MLDGVDVRTPRSIGCYSLRGVIGNGAFSIVMLAHDDIHNFDLACKVVPRSRLSSPELQARFEVEVHIFQQLSHPGIVKLYDLHKDENNYYIFMEYCPNGELFQFIVDNGSLSESQGRFVIRQVLETLEYMHSKGIAHRDMKPENLLISETGCVKLSDFGLSKFVGNTGICETPCGSPCYASPECLSGTKYNAMSSDIWSTGVILFAMLTGQLPWTKRNQVQLFKQIRAGQYKIPAKLSQNCQDFIAGLMTVDIDKRLTIQQAYEHPWMTEEPRIDCQDEDTFQPFVSIRKVDQLFEDDSHDVAVASDLLKCKSIETFTFEKVRRTLIRGPSNSVAPNSYPNIARKATIVRPAKELPPVKVRCTLPRAPSESKGKTSKMKNPAHKRTGLISQSLVKRNVI